MTWQGILHDARGLRIAVLAICVLAHLGLGAWLMRPPVPLLPEPPPLQVIWLTAHLPMPPPPPPPFPTAPPRPQATATTTSTSRTARPALPAQSSMAGATSSPESPPAAAETAPAHIDIGRLLDAASAIAQESRHQPPIPDRRNPMQQRRARLPGRAEPFTPSAIVLRKPISPEDIVKTIGRYFGGGYEPCPDTRRRIDALIARQQPVGEAELRALIDRERRHGCR